MLPTAKEGMGLNKLDLLESRIRALLEERNRLRARVRELEVSPRREPPEGDLRRERHKLRDEREAVRRKVESLLGAIQRSRVKG